ncbi:ABC transporter ATP-binding protein [Xylocopilactobacillus apicola]|uniref:Energy-coupling factor transporter ATP-binding protein EcfA2 n=1 Tax=Xylocopilactobacillus apicola TaxID=2932184 RepID=A0AAU9D9P1_9LACO|nr:ABC transporter ATP-binding protein [Xylocopilactobacillus apicola]BDR58210.1 energy-coupling factor transporter ATP-binding protein EcfA2 [Xylocopilactobacillus apicola]
MLTVKNLNYQKMWQSLNFTLAKDKIYALLGLNGIGKTTLLNLLSGLLPPTSGEILFNGESIYQAKRNYLSQVGYCLQDSENLFFKQTVEEELNYHRVKDVKSVIEKLDLAQNLTQSPFELSGGQQKKLELAIMLLKDPQILFCDEITAGLDAENLELVMNSLLNYRPNHIVVLVTHNLSEALNYADDFLFLHPLGIDLKSRSEVLANPEIFKSFGLINPPNLEVCQALIDRSLMPAGNYYQTSDEIAHFLAQSFKSTRSD